MSSPSRHLRAASSVSVCSRWKPISAANRSAPSPTSIRCWGNRSITSRAIEIGWAYPRTAAKAQAAATRGVGSPHAFSIFQGDDGMSTTTGFEAVGDTRLVPDLDRLAGGLEGWGWAPGDLYDQDGEPWDFCTRSFLKRQTARLAEAGFEMKMSYEHEWYAETSLGKPAHSTPAYSLSSTAEAAAYMREVAMRLAAFGVTVDQIHPEYSYGQA